MGGCCNWPWEDSCTTPQNCINVPNNCDSSSSCDSLLLAFPGVRTCAEAMGKLGERVGKRLHSKVLVTKNGGNSYVFSTTKDRRRIQFTITVTNPCALPLTVASVVGCGSTNSASLGTVDQFLDWVEEIVK